MKIPANIALGKAGELRVASELLLRGHEVFMTQLDSGADIVLGNGVRIQVKAAHKNIYQRKHRNFYSYKFSVKRWSGERRTGRFVPHRFKNIDFIVCWAVDDDMFAIIPSSVVRGKTDISFSLNNKGRATSQYRNYFKKWDLIKR